MLNTFIFFNVNSVKLLTLIISLMMFLCSPLLAQSGWLSVYSCDTTALQSNFFIDVNTGYAVGAQVNFNGIHPIVLKTTNAGSSWFEQITPQRDSSDFFCRSVFFTDINTGFVAVCNNANINLGRILKTTNGGNTWTICPLPVDKHMTTVYFVNSSTGFASGLQYVYRTTNYGTSWQAQQLVSTYLFAIHFTDVNTGYVVGNSGSILKTTNGGINWDYLNSGTGLNLNGLSFADANTGIAVGGLSGNTQNIILRTTNAGNNWTAIPYTTSTCLLWSVRFINPNTGWITGWCGQVIKTMDGGLNWYNQGSYSDNYRTSFFLNSNTGYIVGQNSGRILKTTDGGGNFVGIDPVSNEIPNRFELYQNFPNPFNPSTNIRIDLSGSSFVNLTIYDIMGREAATLVNEQLASGTYEVNWDASNYPSGTYFYKLNADGFNETKKMILIK